MRWLTRRRLLLGLPALLLAWSDLLPLGSAGRALAQTARPDFAQTDIFLTDADGRPHKIRAELARTPAQRRHGLMFKTDMAEDEGMLFVFHGDSLRVFWMRDTPLWLDLLFFTKDGQLVHLIEWAEPLNDRPLSSLMPVRYVLELKAGSAARLGLGPGTRLRIPPDRWRRPARADKNS